MKAMIMSDLLIAKKYLLQQLGVSIAVGIFITVMIGNLYVAAPMVGGMLSSTLLTLLVIPVIYALVKGRQHHLG